MQSIIEIEYLKLCKQKIEAIIHLGHFTDWTQQDYEHLSELIYEKTNVQLSISTLKRLWIYKTATIPSITTLDTLSRFLGYKDWYDFKSKHAVGNLQEFSSGTKRKNIFTEWNYKTIIYTTLAAVLVTLVVILLAIRNAKMDPNILNPDDVVFKLKNDKLNGVPNTVEFQYDISKIGSDSAYIQQDWDPARRVKVFSNNKSLLNTYHYPGYFEASLVIDNKVIKKIPVLIETDGWIPVVLVERFQVKPAYIDKRLIATQNLHISPENIKASGIDITKDYFTNFYNIRDFGNITCESVTLISEIRNNVDEGGSYCQYAEIILKFQGGRLLTPFSNIGCTSTLDVEYGEKYLDGSENNFSSLGTDLSDWKNIKIQVINKHVFVFIEGVKVYDEVFEASLGKLVGLQYCFNGCGSVRKTELSDRNGNLVYADYYGNEPKVTR